MLLLAGLVLAAILALPDRPQTLRAVLAAPPLELPLLLLALVLLRPGSVLATVLRLAVTLWLMAVLVLKTGDFGMRTAFNRPFNLLLDLPLLGSAWDLASGAVGAGLAALAVAALAGALVLVAVLLWWATGVWTRLAPPAPARRLVALGAAFAGVLVLIDATGAGRRLTLPIDPPGQTLSTRLLPARIALLRQSLTEIATFTAAADADPFTQTPGLLDRLAGREVILTFIESYGRTSFDTPLYADTHLPTLRAAETALTRAGFALRSGWLTSPIIGGQSWLAHGTLVSGLRTDTQTRYGAMLASPRRTLFSIASDAGYQTTGVMPAITLAWPEGPLLGLDRIFPAADLGYRGRPYNWVTMPDQFTLTALDRIRAGAGPQPQFTKVVLISSHAPWVPVPELVDWDAVGDGTILNRWAEAGDPPQVVWRDRNRVRDQYRQAIDYSLRAALGHAARQTGALPLIILLGDHQPAPFVSLSESRDVAIHVIGPPDLVALIDGWGWTPGLVPDPALPAWPMEAFRDRFLAAFSTTAPAP